MPLLTILAFILALQPVQWPAAVAGGPGMAIGLTLLAHGSIVALTWFLCSRFSRALRHPQANRPRIIGRYLRSRPILSTLNLLAMAVSLGALGWGHAVQSWGPAVTVGEERVLAPFVELIILLPAMLTSMLSWIGHHQVEKAIRESMSPPSESPFYSRLGYVRFQFRMYALLILTPAILTAAQLSFSRLFPAAADHPLMNMAGFLVAIFGLVVFPLFVPFVLGLSPLPPGPLRDRLDALAKRAGFRHRDWLFWPTRGSMANAFVVGVIPQARYVIFSDRLLELLMPDEIDAVCGHEIGHVRHGHIPYYAAFLALSGMVVFSGTLVVLHLLANAGWLAKESDSMLLATVPIIALGIYLFFAFGFVSRGCERQADLAGCRAGSCLDPNCYGHYGLEHEIRWPESLGPLCPTGIRTFCRALDAVAGGDSRERRSFVRRLLDKLRAWQHGPVPDRIRFLEQVLVDPSLAERFERRFFVVKCLILFGLTLAACALGWLATITS